MKHRLLLVALLPSLLSANPCPDPTDCRLAMLWEYGDFLQVLENRIDQELPDFFNEQSVIGFGGSVGYPGFQLEMQVNPGCYENLVFALKQGCLFKGEGSAPECTAPPQFSDDNILYLGARVTLYLDEQGQGKVRYLICGGD